MLQRLEKIMRVRPFTLSAGVFCALVSLFTVLVVPIPLGVIAAYIDAALAAVCFGFAFHNPK